MTKSDEFLLKLDELMKEYKVIINCFDGYTSRYLPVVIEVDGKEAIDDIDCLGDVVLEIKEKQ